MKAPKSRTDTTSTGYDHAWRERAPHLGGACLLFILQHGAARDHELPPAVAVLQDSECVDAPNVHGRIRVPHRINLRHGAERTLVRDDDVETGLAHALHFAFHRQPRAKGIVELTRRGRAALQFA
jgi:hypothetical protein